MELRTSGDWESSGNGLNELSGFNPPPIMLGGCKSNGCGWALRPSCGEIFRRKCGECSFGFGLALCRLRERLELNIILHPSTVHLCISRKCTAEKCIFKAPLSQNVFKHTLHWTRFLPVAGLINCVPKFNGTDPHCRLPGDCTFRTCPRARCIDCPDVNRDNGDLPDFGLRLLESLLKFNAFRLWWEPLSVRWWPGSLLLSVAGGALLFLIFELFIKFEKEVAIKLAANGFRELAKELGWGDNANGMWCPVIVKFIKPVEWFGNLFGFMFIAEVSDIRLRACAAATCCCKWCRSSSGLNDWWPAWNADRLAAAAPNRRKSNGCIFCRWFSGLDALTSVDVIAVAEIELTRAAPGLCGEVADWFLK